jgi:hypothetical protein
MVVAEAAVAEGKVTVEAFLAFEGETWIVTLPLAGSASFRSEVLGGAEIGLEGLYRNSGL